ncbi:MAG: recombinase family protein, partial [Chloroflexi bacterium]|nr:recombinase family protein [Chloroflexota bacterium]
MERVGIYLRISDDRDGTQTATKRQLEDCRKYAASRGWEVVDAFEDIDISAYKRTAKRPEFERMLAAVRDHDIDGVLAWKMDRFTRRQRDLVRLDEQCEESGGFIATAVEGIDTRQATGRFIAELLVAQARMESENTSTRVKRAHEQMASRGQPLLGGTRAFGYTRDRKAIVPEEAELIREAARRVLAGAGIRGICFDWDARGVKSPTGKAIKQGPLRRVLTNPMISGQREYEGRLIPGTWPPILSPEEVQRLRAIIEDRNRRKNNGNARSYLLSGFLRCGRCNGVMVARPRDDKVRRYVCSRQPGFPNCGKMARLAESVEQVVTEAVFLALEGADLTQYMKRQDDQADTALVESVTQDEAALEELSRDYYADKAITRAEFFAAREVVHTRLDQNRSRLARTRNNGVMVEALSAGVALRKQWAERPLEWRRAVIGAVIDHVVIHPAVKGRNIFDPELVEPVWR